MSVAGSGVLAAAFSDVAFKRLTTVETESTRSNQHEFNASAGLREAFGPDQPQRIETDFVWMPDDGEFLREQGILTWYDARARHPRRSEYRLYYRDNAVTRRGRAGDLLLLARRFDGTALLVMAPGSGLAAARLAWLFGIEAAPGAGFAALAISPDARRRLAEMVGVGPVQDASGWEVETPMIGGRASPSVRRATGQVQRSVASAVTEEPGWDDLIVSLPDDAPSAFAGEALSRTIRGVLGGG